LPDDLADLCPVRSFTIDLVSAKYGGRHQTLKARAMAALTDGQACARCATEGRYHPLYRSMSSRELELDHDDLSGGYLGLSAARCNRRHGGRKGRAIQLAAAAKSAKPLLRPCCECGVAFSPSTMMTITCGRPACVAALKASRKAWEPDPSPPAASGRRW
jgi:hypothetical protein